MKLDSSFVGTPLREYRTTVEWRATMNYAAAIDDENPLYFDDEGGKAVIAPPMFAVAATWPIAERIWEFIEDKNFPVDIIKTQVHYTEHLAFHRPVRPGDELTIRGRVAAIMPHRAGTVTVIRFDALDREGQGVFTEHIGAMMRGVECVGESRGGEDIPLVPSAGIETPARWERVIRIDRMRPFVYDGCTNIYFPIHTSVGFARMVGLPDIILQGTATLAYAAREMADREAGGDSRKIKELACRFTGMVVPPGDIRVRLTGKRDRDNGVDLFFEVHGDGGRVLSNGYARVAG
ncbi:MAG: MaoC family dehydratase N-terminal domain-containing protein [Spirochaetes bacterium]|jgi:acyl dehydratase|nr:MaoC family dehydratase N-terminal domain-containing protein [Spirochaetota bacterium]